MEVVTVIGGSGFIGTCLVRSLNGSNQFRTKIVDKIAGKSFPEKTTIGDVRSISQMRESVSEGSIIVNLAAEHRDDIVPTSLYCSVLIKPDTI